MMKSKRPKQSGSSMYSSKNKRNPFAGNYKNSKTASKTAPGKYMAPSVRNLYSKEGIKDYQSSVIYPQVWVDNFGHQGSFLDSTKRQILSHAYGGDKAQCLVNVQQGQGPDNRIGNRIVAKSINLVMNIKPAPFVIADEELDWVRLKTRTGEDPNYVYAGNGTVTGYSRRSTNCRIVIFIDTANNLLPPTLSDLFEVGTVSAGAAGVVSNSQIYTNTSQLKATATTRFKILYNELIRTDNIEPVTWSKYIPLEGLGITFKSNVADPGSLNNNGVWMFALSTWDFKATMGDNAIQEVENRNKSSHRIDYTAKFRFIP